MKMRLTFTPVQRFSRKVERMPRAVSALLDEEMRIYGDKLLESVVRHASGRPGPNIVTGEYISRMELVRVRRTATVSNSSPQTRRLEYGFIGRDSLGRLYNQPPFPHFAPALAEVRPQFNDAIRRIPTIAWSSL